MTYNRTSLIKGLVLFLLLFLSTTSGRSQTIDPVQLSHDYAGEAYVMLDHHVEMVLSHDKVGKLISKTKYHREYFSIHDGVQSLSRFLLTFSPSQKVNVTMARFYDVDSLGKKTLFHNVKTKFLKERDYFINGIFYGDVRSKEIFSEFYMDAWTYLVLEYEVVDTDMKFLNRIFVSPRGEPVLDFSLNVKTPFDVELDMVAYNTEGLDLGKINGRDERTFTIKDIPGLKDTEHSPPINYMMPHFVPVVRSIAGEDFLNGPQDLYKWYNSLIKELQLNDASCKVAMENVIDGATADEEKIERIFDFVKGSINYIAYEDGVAGFKPAESRDVLVSGYGDCKGVSNLLVDMLRQAGIDAGHAWIGTRDRLYTYDLASPAVDNHMVCWVRHEDRLHILDATGRDHAWNVIPSHLQGKQVMVGKVDAYEIVTLPERNGVENPMDLRATIDVSYTEFMDKIEGTFSIKGNEARDIITAHLEMSVTDHDNNGKWIIYYYFGRKFSGLHIQSFTYDLDNERVDIQFAGNVLTKKLKRGTSLYVYPDIESHFLEVDEPECGLYFANKAVFTSHLEYRLPSGMKASQLPETIGFDCAEFRCSSSSINSGSIIKIDRTIEIKTLFSGYGSEQTREDLSNKLDDTFDTPIIIN